MKSYEEMTQAVFTRIAEENKKRKARNKLLLTAAPLCALCAALLGLGLWQVSRPGQEPIIQEDVKDPTGEPDWVDETIGGAAVTVEDLPEALAKLDFAGKDQLGWIVWRGVVYLQIATDPVGPQPGDYLGSVLLLQGFYQARQISGELYAVAGDPTLLLAKLSNGATILLSSEYEACYGQKQLISSYPGVAASYETPGPGEVGRSIPLKGALKEYGDSVLYHVLADLFDGQDQVLEESLLRAEAERLTGLGYRCDLEPVGDPAGESEPHRGPHLVFQMTAEQLQNFDPGEPFGYFLFLVDEKV